MKKKSVEQTITKVPCYNNAFIKEKLEKNGWCYTCNITANKGDPGYCGSGMDRHDNSTESIPKSILGRWGVCDDGCRENRYFLKKNQFINSRDKTVGL